MSAKPQEEEMKKKIVVKGDRRHVRELWRCVPFFNG